VWFAEVAFYYPDRRHRIGDHAAKWETSCLWHLRPDCVDLSVYRGREDESLINVLGDDPRTTATVEDGRKACELMVVALVKKAEDLLAEE
jgi:creatinine amidohydrolase/Fe(II)-dependent formamide hydrolase-like protein